MPGIWGVPAETTLGRPSDIVSVRTQPPAGMSFSSSESASGSEEEMEEEGPSTTGSRKRKRSSGPSRRSRMMAFFEGLTRQLMEKQEAMQQRFLEAMEKMEQDRMVREEAWKLQETARLVREHEILAQERAVAASRYAAIIALLQKLTGQIPQLAAIPPAVDQASQPQPNPDPPPAPPAPQQQSPTTKKEQQMEMMGGSFDPVSSSRWPKEEVLALINLHSRLESRYQEAGPKGPLSSLWEDISAGMQQMGYSRSSKKCNEKWQNINKYFRRVKERYKKRPEEAKSCPYFHQLDTLYNNKEILGSGGSSGGGLEYQTKQEQDMNPNSNPQERWIDILAIMPPPPPPSQLQPEAETKSSSNGNESGADAEGGSSLQVQTSNGGFPRSFFEKGPLKKIEVRRRHCERADGSAGSSNGR